MLQNAYFLAKIGADTAENEQHFAEILPTDGAAGAAAGAGEAPPASPRRGGRSSCASAWRSPAPAESARRSPTETVSHEDTRCTHVVYYNLRDVNDCLLLVVMTDGNCLKLLIISFKKVKELPRIFLLSFPS